MGLWNPLNRVMVAVAGISVLAACYAVAAWGQDQGAFRNALAGRVSQVPTITVANLRIPESAWRHYQKATDAAQRHRNEEFERESAKALQIAPGFATMYLLRATVQIDAHDYEAAVASIQTAAQLDPNAMWTTVILAGAYNGMRRFNEALLVLNAKRGVEAETWQAKYERARAETGAQNVQAALFWSGMALNSAPEQCADVHLVRANALLLDDRLGESEAQMEIYLHSKQPQTHRTEVAALRDAVRARRVAQEHVSLPAPPGSEADREIVSR